MDYSIQDERVKRLIEIGTIFESIGVDSVKLAESIKEHIENCPGGRTCLETLLQKNSNH